MIGVLILASADKTLHAKFACVLPFTQAHATRTFPYVRVIIKVIFGQAFFEHAQFLLASTPVALDYLDWPLAVTQTTSDFVLLHVADFAPAIVHERVGGNCVVTRHSDTLTCNLHDHTFFVAPRN